MGANSYCLLSIGVSVDLAVTSITASSGTFIKLGHRTADVGTFREELWLGYNFGNGNPTTLTVNRAAGGGNMGIIARVIDIDGNAAILPTFNTATSSGSSTSGNSGSITPPVGDILVAGLAMNSLTADSTARAHTGNAFWMNTNAEGISGIRTEMGWGLAQAAVSTSETWTLAATTPWAGIIASITPAAPPAPGVAKLVKGHTTAVLDASSPY